MDFMNIGNAMMQNSLYGIENGPDPMYQILGVILIASAILGAAVYVYLGFAFTAIGRRAKLKTPELAWIPAVGPLIIAYQTAKMHWWPWLMFASLLVMWIPFVGLFVYVVAMTILAVYSTIWMWKMFEKVKRPGWWAIIGIISTALIYVPFVGLVIGGIGSVASLILIGIAAWGK